MKELKNRIVKLSDYVINIRRELHQIPELGFNEFKTAEFVARELKNIGLDVKTRIAGTGVVGQLDTGKPGPIILLRSDMDALPVQEATGLPFESKTPGTMHACGHDGHMAMLLGAAKVLQQYREELTGCIKFLFQPAEEGPGGAELMIEEGVMKNPDVDYVFGCHLWPSIPEGSIGVTSGPFMASAIRFDIHITGKGGHGGIPHESVDALDVGVQVVNALQRIVSRQSDPLKPTVISTGSFHSGTAFNVIPETAVISGTARTFDEKLWANWGDRISQIVGGVCDSMGAGYEVEVSRGYPVTVNDEDMSQLIRRCAADTVGSADVTSNPLTMGSEDFSFFLKSAKGCYFTVGVGRPGGQAIHHPSFDFNEEVLLNGVEVFSRAVLSLK